MPKPFTKADADKAETLEAQIATSSNANARAAVTAGCQVYWPAPYEVCGRIRDKYNQTNGPNGFLLFPKSNELTNPGNTGKRSEFLGGNIYWSAATDAHPVAHDFLTKWGEKGYESGFMKYPTTDEIGVTGGIRQEYQGGSIYFSFGTGAHAIYGLIRDRWQSLGAETSYLGFPTTDEQATLETSLGSRENRFQAGSVIANLKNNTTQYLGFYANTNPASSAKAARAQSVGPQLAGIASEPLKASDIPPGGQVPVAKDCPDSASNYTNLPEWNCRWIEEDLNDQDYWGRLGVERGRTVRNDSGDDISNGFGMRHAFRDHNVTSRAIQLMIRVAPFCIPIFRDDKFDRCEFCTNVVAMPSAQVTHKIYVVEQTTPDRTSAAPIGDVNEVGIITAHCASGVGGVLADGFCDDEWMGPYRNIGIGEE